jgi:hypothetical protein
MGQHSFFQGRGQLASLCQRVDFFHPLGEVIRNLLEPV